LAPEPPADAAALLAALPWGVLVLDAQDVVRYVNPQATAWCGAAAALLGQPLAEAPLPATLGAALRHLLPEAAAPREVWLPGTRQWLSVRAAPAPAGQRWVFLEDATASHQAEAAQQHSSQLLLDMEAVAHTGSYEADLASGSFYFSDGLYHLFGEAPQAFEVTLEVINARSHPDDVATVRQVLDEAVRTRQPYTYRRRIRRADGQWRTLEAHGEVRTDATGQPVQLRGVVQDVTERVQAKQQQGASHELLRHTIDSSLDLVQVFEAVRDEQGAVVDFAWVLNNAAAEQVYGDVIGQRLRQLNPGVVEMGIFDTFRQVLETGVPDQSERHYVHEQFDGWFYQSTVKLGDGVTTTTHDITARKQAEQALRESQALLQDIIDAPNIGLAVYRAVRNEAGEVVDFVHEYINRASVEMLGEDFTGKRFTDHGENGRLQLPQLREVLATGRRNSYLREADFRGQKVWFAITNTPLNGERLVHTWEDVTARQQAEAELRQLKEEVAQQATNKYRLLFETMTEGLTVCGVVRDDAGRVVDLLNLAMNPAVERQMGVDCQAFIGRRLSEVFTPGDVARWLPLHAQVADSGEPVTVEDYVEFTDRWYELSIYRSGADELSVFVRNITERKQQEQQQAFLLMLSDALRAEPNAEAIGTLATRLVAEHLHVDRCYIAQLSRTQELGRIGPEYRAAGLPPLSGEYRFADFPEGMKRLETGPLVIRDLLHDPSLSDTDKQSIGQLMGVQGLLAAILRRGERHYFWGLYAATTQPRDWTEADLKFLENVAERTWAAMERARTETALRQSEDKYRTLFDTIDEGFCIVEAVRDEQGAIVDFMHLEANSAYHVHTRLQTIIGRTVLEVLGETGQELIEKYSKVVRTGVPVREEYYIEALNGWYTAFHTRVENTERVAIVFNNITERKRREQEQAFLLTLSDALRPLADVVEIQRAASRVAGEYLGVDRAYYCDIEPDGDHWVVADNYVRPGVPPLLSRGRIGDFGWAGDQLRAGNMLRISDVATDPNLGEAARAEFQAVHIAATLCIPLVKEGRWVANFTVQNVAPHEWSEVEIQLAEVTAERTWAALERAKAEAALRTSEARYAALFAASPVPFMVVAPDAPDFTILAANDAYYATTYSTPADLIGQRMLDVFTVDDTHPGRQGSAAVAHSVARVLATKQTEVMPRLRYDLVRPTGELEPRWWLAVNAPLFDAAGEVSAIIHQATDVTALYYAEVAEQKHQQQQAFLLKLSDALRPLADPLEIQRAAMRVLGEQLGVDRTLYAEISPDDEQFIIGDNYVRGEVPKMSGRFPLSAFGRIADAQRAGELTVVDDLRSAGESDEHVASYLALGVHAILGIPLHKGGRWIASVAVHSGVPRRWTPEETALAQETAERTWAAVERARAEAALRESEAKYRTLFDSIDEGFALEELVYDADGEIADIIFREVNRSYERQGGLTNVVGKSIREVLPHLEQHWKDVYAQVARTGEPVRLINYAQDVDRWFDTYLTLLAGSNQYVAVVFNDITERKRRELNSALLDEIGKDFAILTAPDELMQAVGQRLSDFLALSGCYFVDVDEAKNEVSVHYGWASGQVPSLMQTFQLEDYLSEDFLRTMRAGEVFVLPDTAQDSRAEAESYARLQVGSFVTVPFFRQGRYVGHIAVTTERAHAWQPQEIQLLEEVSSRVFPRIERARTEEALRKSEEKYRRVFEDIDQGFSVHELLVDESGQVTDVILQEVNAAFEQHTGIQHAQGKKVSEIVPNLEPVWLEAMTRAYKWGETQRFEAYNVDTNRWITSQYSRLGGAGSRLLSTIFTDITERKQREQHQEFLLKLSDALRPGADSAALERAALQVLGETLGADRVFLATVRADDTSWSVREEYTAGLPGGTGTYPLSEFQLKRLPQWQAGQLSSTADSETDPSFSAADRAAYAAFGLRAAIGVPLVKGGRFTALLCVNQATPRRWTAAELALTSEAAERIWVALERARAEEALAASEQRLRTVLQQAPLAVAITGPTGEIIFRNAVFDQLWGRPAHDTSARTYSDVYEGFHPDGRPVASEEWPAARAVLTGEVVQGEVIELVHLDGQRIPCSFNAAPIRDEAGIITGSVVLFQDVSAERAAQQAVQASEHRLRALITNLPGAAAFVVGPDLRYQLAGGEALDAAGLTPADLLGRTVAEAMPPALVPQYETHYRQALAGQGFSLEHTAHCRTFISRGVPLLGATGQPEAVQVVSYDITARKQAEEALRRSEQRLQQALSIPTVGVLFFDLDGAIHSANETFQHLSGYSQAEFVSGQVRWETLTPPEFMAVTLKARQEYVTYGQNTPYEKQYLRPDGSRWWGLFAGRRLSENEYVEFVLDVTARRQAEEDLRQSEEEFRTVANLVPDLLWRSDAQGDTTWYNQRWLDYTGQTPAEAAHGWVEAIHPDDRAQSARRYREVLGSGQPLQQEHRIRSAQGEYRWFLVQALPIRDAQGRVTDYFGTATDIHLRKLAEEAIVADKAWLEGEVAERTRELRESRDLLQSVFDTSLISMSVLKTVRDEAGAVQDFRLVLASQQLERETGRTDLEGKLYSQQYPGIREVGVFDLAVRAVATGEPQGMEYFYDHEGLQQWFACQFVKMGDGLVATNLDITERKQAEQERLKNLRLLEQAEAVAGLGSWDYDLATGHLRWSEGMYHLVGLPLGQPVSPAVYLRLVTDYDRPRAEHLVHRLTTGQSAEETLRLRVGEQVKTVHVKAVVLRNEAGQPARMLGVDLDISELQRLEADNLHLRLSQQQALFEAVQAAQEAERKRMAESLHNGIGQILYATKLRLDRLHAPALGADPALRAIRQEAGELLGEAIRQTRTLSHELVSLVLEEFGLAAALHDISTKMRSPQLYLRSSVYLDEAAAPLTPTLQLALYRMAQELAQNTIKHAHGATTASLELETMPGWVLLRMEDNGPGFAAPPATEPGLGLRSIRDRVALLEGELELGSLPSGGAYVRIRIPLPHHPHPDKL